MDSLDLIPAGIAICDPDARIQTLNATLRDWLGEAADSLIDQPFHALCAPAGKIYFETHIRPMLMVEGEISEISLQLRGPSRARRRIYLNGRVQKGADGAPLALYFACFDGTQRFGYEQELLAKRRAAESYQALVLASPDAIVALDLNHRITGWNRAAENLFGTEADTVIGSTAQDALIPDVDGPAARTEREIHHADGTRIPVEIHTAQVEDEFNRPIGTISVVRDIRERRASEDMVAALNMEVIHRSKNQLAVIQAIARNTAKHTAPEDFNTVFFDRLSALSRNAQLLITRQNGCVGIRALIQSQLAHLGPDENPKVVMRGADVQLPEAIAEALGLALFELSTNAAKYGALSAAGGPDSRLELSWGIEPDSAQWTFHWRESGLRDVQPPSRAGFGSQLTGSILERASEGEVVSDFTPTGLHWQLQLQADALST